jgi:hypothetical protein
MIQSFLLLVAAIFGLFLPVLAQHMTKSQQKADGPQKTEQACLAEWRAIKPASRAKGTTQQGFIQQCRSGTATAQASGSSAPSTNGTATPLQKPSPTPPHLAKRSAPERHARTHTHGRRTRGKEVGPRARIPPEVFDAATPPADDDGEELAASSLTGFLQMRFVPSEFVLGKRAMPFSSFAVHARCAMRPARSGGVSPLSTGAD